jgi:hypothetical protein
MTRRKGKGGDLDALRRELLTPVPPERVVHSIITAEEQAQVPDVP